MDHPAFMRSRLAVRRALTDALAGARGRVAAAAQPDTPLVLVGLSGGADSLALAAAVASEARALGIRAGALVVDHGLQEDSAAVAERAAEQAAGLGLDPVVVRAVSVDPGQTGGPEAAARRARYSAFTQVAEEHGASWVLTAHTRDDQAEQVLLALARGSGLRALAGIPLERELAQGVTLLRPFLWADPGITRENTLDTCAEVGLEPWHDPHNDLSEYARVRVRHEVLPVLHQELGAQISANLARTADLAREDADALDALAASFASQWVVRRGASSDVSREGVSALLDLPAALRQRVIRRIAHDTFPLSLTREHTLAVAALVTDWHGQGPIQVPSGTVTREQGELHFDPTTIRP